MTFQWILLGGYAVLAVLSEQRMLVRGESWIGLALLLMGGCAVLLAVLEYRKRMGTVIVKASPEPTEASRLMTGGIYGYIRHPIYTGAILAAVGAALILHKPACLAAAAMIGLLYTGKSYYEEGLLIRRFPEYVLYRKRTGRFLPKLLQRNL